MFAGFESRQAWIVDVLQPEYVVKEIVHAIQTNANMVLLPKILNIVFVLQAILPRRASYLLGKWAGIHDCMNNVSISCRTAYWMDLERPQTKTNNLWPKTLGTSLRFILDWALSLGLI